MPKTRTAKQKKELGLSVHNRAFFPIDFLGWQQTIEVTRGTIRGVYDSLATNFSNTSINLPQFQRVIWPLISSGAALLVGDYLTTSLSQYQTGREDKAYLYKFLLGSAFLGYCALQRLNEKKTRTTVELSAIVASEVLAISYLYSSTFLGTRDLLADYSDSYSLIASLGVSAVVMPTALAHLSSHIQQHLIKKDHTRGAQRVDTALSAGLSPLSNTYFKINHFLGQELLTGSRLFQLCLIAYNVIHGTSRLQQFRNFPALLADLFPVIAKELFAHHKHLEQDTRYNSSLEQVLVFSEEGAVLIKKPRQQLKTDDLVFCGPSFDCSSVAISGELVAFKRDNKGFFTKELEQKKFSINLQAKNGEANWLNSQSKSSLGSEYRTMSLSAIHRGKQAGILAGTQLNLYNADNFFIQIKAEEVPRLNSSHQKSSLINGIISKRKQQMVFHSMLASGLMAVILQQNPRLIPAEFIRLLFTLFQAMIPFSETFLREAINKRFLAEFNQRLGENPLEIDDLLRLSDFVNVLKGYYPNLCPQGVAIVSDKTGTLTTSEMKILGLWTTEMDKEVQARFAEKPGLLLPELAKQQACFEVFAAAFTNNDARIEPEEAAIFALFKDLFNAPNCLKISVEGSNHLQKSLIFSGRQKNIESFHLGLYRVFGGRLTLVAEDEKKYLVFCGVPKTAGFANTLLLTQYLTMQSRIGTLSRDWCVARVLISEQQFATLKDLFSEDNQEAIEAFVLSQTSIRENFCHYGTFIIDNPLKVNAENFISQFAEIDVPIFVATGDTMKAAENIARVLCPTKTEKLITLQTEAQVTSFLCEGGISANSTVIFAGLNRATLACFKVLIAEEKNKRPVVIFAEMSTEDKGRLAAYLKAKGFFVVANGDGSNDVLMMQEANLVIAHTNDNSFAPGVGPLVNLSEKQLQLLLGTPLSFYQHCDLHLPKSLFKEQFMPFSNTQGMATRALALKAVNMGGSLAKAVGVSVIEMPNQHWWGIGFDLTWLALAFSAIRASADSPIDNQHLRQSTLITKTTLAALALAGLQALITYSCSGESTNLTTMLIILSLVPWVLKYLFSPQQELQVRSIVQEERNSSTQRSLWSTVSTFFSPIENRQEQPNKEDTKRLIMQNVKG